MNKNPASGVRRKMMSIVRVDFPALLGEYIRDIENVTKGKVVLVEYDDHSIKFTIEHHNQPVCPNCGSAIHDYGHGLCLRCWTERRIS